VLPIQGKTSTLMIEINHPVRSIVAVRAAPAEIPSMLGDEVGVPTVMTGLAFRVRGREIALNCVTVYTFHRAGVVVHLVFC
jgi:hypothetical protein